ncbi:hypothetical protein, partial [Sphingobacterium sp. N143]|uniref:hypothetical protein n=1 Tax=Sphingobacterium sp. N143 TaxID=2746727 RepID=UPI002578EDEB
RVGRCLFLHGSPCWKQSRASCVWIVLYHLTDQQDTADAMEDGWLIQTMDATLLLDNRLHFIIAFLLGFTIVLLLS